MVRYCGTLVRGFHMSLRPSASFLKVLGLLAIFTLAPGSMYLMYYRTGGPTSNKEQVLQKNLRFAFMAGTETIDLAPLTPWPWVKVCALTSDLTEEQADAVLGFPYKDFDQLFWMHRPEFWTLIFVDSEREASWGSATPVVPRRVSRVRIWPNSSCPTALRVSAPTATRAA